jgi:hypothetical protein
MSGLGIDHAEQRPGELEQGHETRSVRPIWPRRGSRLACVQVPSMVQFS